MRVRVGGPGTMQIDYLREYLAIVEEGSFSAAAVKTHTAQPVLSKHIRNLETDLQVDLLLRSPKGVTVTPRGGEAYESFREIVEKYDDMLRRFREKGNEYSGRLRIGILTMGFDRYVEPPVSKFHADYPNVDIVFSTEAPHRIIEEVANGNLDLGFVGKGDYDDKGVVSYKTVGMNSLNAIVSRNSDAAESEYLVPSSPVARTLVCLKAHDTSDVLNGLLFSAGYNPKKIIEVDGVEVASHAVASQNGFFAIPDFMCDGFRMNRSTVIVGFKEPIYLPVSFAYHTNSMNRLVPLFIDSIS